MGPFYQDIIVFKVSDHDVIFVEVADCLVDFEEDFLDLFPFRLYRWVRGVESLPVVLVVEVPVDVAT